MSVLGGKPAKPPVPVVFGTAQGKEIAAVSALAETPLDSQDCNRTLLRDHLRTRAQVTMRTVRALMSDMETEVPAAPPPDLRHAQASTAFAIHVPGYCTAGNGGARRRWRGPRIRLRGRLRPRAGGTCRP